MRFECLSIKICVSSKMKLLPFLTIVLTISSTQAANILFYWGVSGYSHRISAWSVIEELVEKGHKVTFISPYPSKNPKPHPNITDIVPNNLAQEMGSTNLDFVSLRLKEGVAGIDKLWDVYYDWGIKGCQSLMKNPQVIQWINESSFDLVIINALHNECGYGLIHKFKVPHIMYSTTSHFQWFKEAYGYPDENYPEMPYHYPAKMTFFQSVNNLLCSLYWQWRRDSELFPLLENLLKKSLDIGDLPSLHEIERNISLIFVNTHPSEEFPRSLPPNVVQVGGLHCNDDRKPLTKDVSDFIESSGDEGFILLSFGTYSTLSSLPQHLQDTFLDAIRKIPHVKFLVKYNGDPPKNLPKNAKTLSWVAQQDIIAHPKIRAFIGHGGLLGIQEAIYHGVPMLIVPLFAEQDYQAVRAHGRETAIALEIAELTEEELVQAILEVLNNKKYKENAMKLSKLFRDRPLKPLDTAVWWIEYVLRHKDLSHLRPHGINKTWYERRMLHIWGFLTLIIISAIILISSCVFLIIKKTCFSNSTKSKAD